MKKTCKSKNRDTESSKLIHKPDKAPGFFDRFLSTLSRHDNYEETEEDKAERNRRLTGVLRNLGL